MRTIKELMGEVSALKVRSKWDTAVRGYALDLLGNLWDMFTWDRGQHSGPMRSDRWLEERCSSARELHRKLLNGAPDWHEYSWGGCAIIYNDQLAKNLLTESELKRLGWRRDSDGDLYGGRSEWGGGEETGETLLDAQERALMQAERIVAEAMGLDDGELFTLQELNIKPKRRGYGNEDK